MNFLIDIFKDVIGDQASKILVNNYITYLKPFIIEHLSTMILINLILFSYAIYLIIKNKVKVKNLCKKIEQLQLKIDTHNKFTQHPSGYLLDKNNNVCCPNHDNPPLMNTEFSPERVSMEYQCSMCGKFFPLEP